MRTAARRREEARTILRTAQLRSANVPEHLSRLQRLENRQDPFVPLLHIFTLLSLALSARLYDVLGRQAMFFVARGSTCADVLWFVVMLSVLLPTVVVLAEWLAGLLWRPLGLGVHRAIVWACGAAIVMAA